MRFVRFIPKLSSWVVLLALHAPGLARAESATQPVRKKAPRTAAAPSAAQPTSTLRQRAQSGLYAPGTPYYPERYWALEKKLGVRAEIVSGFVDFEYVFGEPRDLALSLKGKRKLLYSWEPHCVGEGTPEQSCTDFRAVIDGKLDEYFERIALSMQSYPGEIYVRPWAELNAPWSPYRPGSSSSRAGTRDEFIAAWRHLVKFFRTRGINNLRFVFSPDANEDAETVPVASLFPGTEFVDVLGIDGYNWGDGGRDGNTSWREFDGVFADMYRRLTALHPNAPVWICEFGLKEPKRDDGSAESPAPTDPKHDKAQWLERALNSSEFPHLAALVFYSSRPASGYQRDFNVDSSAGSLRATRAWFKYRQGVKRGKRPGSSSR
ncbi:MAG: glycosyl hydrolase [Myxococcales bacterium]